MTEFMEEYGWLLWVAWFCVVLIAIGVRQIISFLNDEREYRKSRDEGYRKFMEELEQQRKMRRRRGKKQAS